MITNPIPGVSATRESGILSAALWGQCPRCRARSVFKALAQVASICESCNLDFAELEGSGRFVGLLTMIIAMLLIGVAWWIEESYRPPLILQMIVWLPVTVGVVIGSLRLFKIVNLYARYERSNLDSDIASSSAAVGDKES